MDLNKLIEELSKCEKPKESDVKSLCDIAKPILIKDGNLVKISTPVSVVGDVHGQLWDLLELFEVSGEVPALSYLFLGDYVDRGFNSLETFLYLLALKVRYPSRIYLLRGNHESKEITQVYGFYDECIRKYGSINVWNQCCEIFKYLTLAALIDERVFCVHGGLSPFMEKIDQIKSYNRIQEVPFKGPITDMLWSDPEEVKGWGLNPRGAGYLYGPEVTTKFILDNNIDLIARSHQLVLEGYKWHFKQKVITVWSAPNYCYRCGNLASVMQLHDNKSRSFLLFESSPEQYKEAVWLPRLLPDYFL